MRVNCITYETPGDTYIFLYTEGDEETTKIRAAYWLYDNDLNFDDDDYDLVCKQIDLFAETE